MKTTEQGILKTMDDGLREGASLEERVARMEDRERIEELLAHYARCVDAQDAQGVGAAFIEDGELCNPGMPALKGRARIAKLYGKLLPAMSTSSHLVGAQQIAFTSKDEALVHAAFQAWDSYKDESALDCFSFGFYEAYVMREADGEWRIAALNVNFAGQLEMSPDGSLRAGQGVNGRFREQFARPWPPAPRE